MILVNKTILEIPLIQSEPLWIENITQIDEIIDNTVANTKVLVEEFNFIKENLVEARKYAKSSIMMDNY